MSKDYLYRWYAKNNISLFIREMFWKKIIPKIAYLHTIYSQDEPSSLNTYFNNCCVAFILIGWLIGEKTFQLVERFSCWFSFKEIQIVSKMQ